MSKIHVLSDQLANQIAAGEVVERPASVVKELVENSIDAGARRIQVESEAGGRRLLRVSDDGEGMTRDDALLAFERHATSKIRSAEDLFRIGTLGFRGEALASIASVAKVELVTKTDEEEAATRVLVEGGRIRDVKPAAHTRGTTITVRELFFNIPARRKFLRSEATESFHLMNLVTHYALAHPEIAFTFTNNGRETLRAAQAADLGERAYQIFGADFLSNLLEVVSPSDQVVRVRGFISAPRERRTSRDAQYLFINGRYVRDPLIGRALSEGYKAVLPQGVYPAALLFLDVPLEEVDVNVHPAKTEVRFRRAPAVADAVREAVRATLASAGYVKERESPQETYQDAGQAKALDDSSSGPIKSEGGVAPVADQPAPHRLGPTVRDESPRTFFNPAPAQPEQRPIKFVHTPGVEEEEAAPRHAAKERPRPVGPETMRAEDEEAAIEQRVEEKAPSSPAATSAPVSLPPLTSIAGLVREVPVESLSHGIRPLGQLEDSFIVATDEEGLLLIDQHAAHERILFDQYQRQEHERAAESQHLLMPETFDLTPAQASMFDAVAMELETYGFGLMRLSGRTVAIKAVPADLPATEARNMLSELLETVDAEKRGEARDTLRERIAATLASRAAVKANTPLAPAKMRWLIDSLLATSSPTTGPQGRPVVLRLATRDIIKGFQKS